MWRRITLTLSLLAFLSCGAPSPPQARLSDKLPTSAKKPTAVRESTAQDAGVSTAASSKISVLDHAASRREWFLGLVADIRGHHVFDEQTRKNLGMRWEDRVPAFAREFEEANDPNKLQAALVRFGNSLHNGHCYYAPATQAVSLTLGVSAGVQWRGGKAVFYVADIDDKSLAGQIEPGDELRAVDDVPADNLLVHYADVSSGNNWRSIALDIADYLGDRRTYSSAAEGSPSHWRIFHHATKSEIAVELRWRAARSGEGRVGDFAISYEGDRCSVLPHRAYGPYELSTRGRNLCLYTSRAATYRDYPIVRHFSFVYIEGRSTHFRHQVRAEHALLSRELARLSPKGVVLDLRDNGGGNNPNWFMDWYAKGTYVDDFVLTLFADDLDTQDRLRAAGIGYRDEFLRDLAARKPGERFTQPRPFFCKNDIDCAWDNRYTPSHPVTKAPVALLVGPDCRSSCDSVARLFAENHFGPLVGEPTAAAHTTLRIDRPVVVPGRPRLGTLVLGLAYEISGKTRQPIEAVPVALDAQIERTFDNRATYDRSLVDAAIGLLGRPKR